MNTDLRRQFEDYSNFVAAFAQGLDTLECDLKLVNEQWALHFAVDFADIFAFLFPLSQQRKITPLPGEDPSKTYSRQQATLSFLFAKLEDKVLSSADSLIMLPPYIQEMQSSLALVRHRLIELYYLTDILHKVRERAFPQAEYADAGIDSIVKACNKYNRSPEEREIEAITRYIKLAYKDLLSLVVSPSYYGALSLLDTMINNGKIISVRNYIRKKFPQEWQAMRIEDILSDYEINREAVSFYKQLSLLRPQAERDTPNRVDSVACATVQRLNQVLIPHKSVLLIVSHSKAMADTASALEVPIKPETGTYSGTRNLDYFWLYFVHKDKDVATTLPRVSQMKRVLDQFTRVKKTLSVETSSEKILEAEQVLKELQILLDYYNNVSVGAQTDNDILGLVEQVDKKSVHGFKESVDSGRRLLRILTDGAVRDSLLQAREDIKANITTLQFQIGRIDALQ